MYFHDFLNVTTYLVPFEVNFMKTLHISNFDVISRMTAKSLVFLKFPLFF